MGHRQKKKPVVAEELLAELQKRPERPIPALCEDMATLEGLIDLLVIKGTINEVDLNIFIQRYQSVITALVMLLIERGIITENDMEKAISAFHYATRHCRPNATMDEIFEARRKRITDLLE